MKLLFFCQPSTYGGTIFFTLRKGIIYPDAIKHHFFACDPVLKRSANQEPQPPRKGGQVEPRKTSQHGMPASALAAFNFSMFTRSRQSSSSFEIVCKGTTFFWTDQIFLRKNVDYQALWQAKELQYSEFSLYMKYPFYLHPHFCIPSL